MARPGVTEKEVFEAIQSLMEIGAKVTVESVRTELGHGSPNTINRHLRTWREKPNVSINSQSQLQISQLKKKQITLERELLVQAEKGSELSQIILMRDQKILELEGSKLNMEQELREVRFALEKLQGIETAAALERQALIRSLVEAQQEQAEQFREDLKAINNMSLEKVRDISLSAQERWVEEKAKVKFLNVEIEQLKVTNKSLEEKVLQLQTAQVPLRKKIQEQEQTIARVLQTQEGLGSVGVKT